ncbi:MAG TPA: nucleotide exchange factor GrpE [Spirochaetaceae bacterium]|jgi:molecular chaperone GrpE|nr:nucleotide exchange factor GrpE [Spirochaetaceae bacterium]
MSKQAKRSGEETADHKSAEQTKAPQQEFSQETSAEQADEHASANPALLAEKDERIVKLEEELSSLKDQYLRKLADYENFRKRMFREKEDAVGYANSQILTDLVTVLDDFDRAVHSSENSKDFQSLHDGVAMIHRTLLSTLENKYGLSRFDSLNQPFDPNRHEAMMSEQGECEEPLVAEEYVKGYMLKDRVLRSAKVKVRMPEQSADQA